MIAQSAWAAIRSVLLQLQIDEGKLKKAHDKLGYDTAEIRRTREEKVATFTYV